MVITMRLYRMHDLDLLYLYKMPDISIQKIIRNVLKAYVVERNSIHGIQNRVVIPRTEFPFKTPKSALIHIRLDDENDKAVVEWIEQIPKGVRNAMLKNILRGYLSFPMTIPYETDVANTTTNNTTNLLSGETKKKTTKKTTSAKKTEKKEDVAQDVLSAPLYSDSPTKTTTYESETASEVLEHTENVTKPQVAADNKPSNSDEDADVFDDFEAMMKDF